MTCLHLHFEKLVENKRSTFSRSTFLLSFIFHLILPKNKHEIRKKSKFNHKFWNKIINNPDEKDILEELDDFCRKDIFPHLRILQNI